MDRTETIEQIGGRIFVSLVTDHDRDPQEAAELALAQAKIFANVILKAQQTELWPQIKTNGEPK
jgi:hypothetical protein